MLSAGNETVKTSVQTEVGDLSFMMETTNERHFDVFPARLEHMQDIQNRVTKLKSTPEEALPPGSMLKDFIRTLKEDIKDEAERLVKEKHFETAGHILTQAINAQLILYRQGYGFSSTLDKKIFTLRAECANVMGYPKAALEDCAHALEIDNNYESANVAQVVAQYEIARLEWAKNNSIEFLMGFEMILYQEYPAKILELPRVKAIIAELNQHLDPIRACPPPTNTPNVSQDSSAVVEEWLPAHVKASKKTNAKGKSNNKSKKKKKSKVVVEVDFSDTSSCVSVADSVVSSASNSPRQQNPAQPGVNPTKAYNAASKSSKYGLDDFGPVPLPTRANGAIPKVSSSSQRPRASSSTSTQSSQGATNTGAASFATANSNNQDDSLYCDVCKVYLNADKQLVQHRGGSKHIAKQAEYMRNQQSGLAAGKPAENSANFQQPKLALRTSNRFDTLASGANLSPSPTVQNSTQSPLAAAAAAAAGATAAAATSNRANGRAVQNAQAQSASVGPPPPRLSYESLEWLKKFTFRLACEKCYVTDASKYGYERHMYRPDIKHLCFGGWLVCKLGSVSTPKIEVWGRIRPRTKPDFNGIYTLCKQFETGIACKIGEDSCWYCHSKEEIFVWKADREGNFNGKEIVAYLRHSQGIGVSRPREVPPKQSLVNDGEGFKLVMKTKSVPSLKPGGVPSNDVMSISQRTTKTTTYQEPAIMKQQPSAITNSVRQGYNILMSRVRGHFMFLCERCFDGAPPMMCPRSTAGPYCSNNDSQHAWEKSKVLVSILAMNGRYRYQKARPRPKGIPARANLCWNLTNRFGCRFGNPCKFAHNEVEIEVWEVELLYSLNREALVQLCAEAIAPRPAQPSVKVATSAPIQPTPSQPSAPSKVAAAAVAKAIPKFTGDVKYVCGMCFPRGNQCIGQNPRKPEFCAGANSHPWQLKMVVVYEGSKKKWVPVKPRHPWLRSEVHPKLCRHGDSCHRASCMFPHHPAEGTLWRYMAQYNLKSLDEVMAIKFRPPSTPINQPSAEASAMPTAMQSEAYMLQSFYCTYCDQPFQQLWKLEEHTKSLGHRSRVNCDKERQWKYRSPPWNVLNGRYQECEPHKRRQCTFSQSPAENNNCTRAHTLEELEEWRERHQYRMMKMKKAKEQKLFAFMDEILTKYNYSTEEMSVITEELPGIRVDCEQELNKFLKIKRKSDSVFTFTWKFLIKSKKQKVLKRVGLLYDQHRLHFYLSDPKGEDIPQVCPGNRIAEGDGETYRVSVIFHSRMLGSFNQWVLFDFGSEPVLVRKLEAHVGSEEHFETFKKIQREKKIQTWDSSNCEIVKFPDDVRTPPDVALFEKKILAAYKPPASLSIDDIELGRLDRDNYKLHMQKMLHLEEREQTKRIARFSIASTLKVTATIEEDGLGHHYATSGQLFGSINLKQALVDDSEASQIINRSVQKMLLKFDKTNKVYEAVILPGQDFGSQNQDSISLNLSEDCVNEQHLTSGQERQVQIQFQLNRMSFCHMHNAVEKLDNMDIVFPPTKQRLPFVQKDQLTDTNLYQERAAAFISSHGGSDSYAMQGAGPVLVYGPFGTGKTYTLATAVKRTVAKRPHSRILICTQSNSAADWYITEFLHKFVESTWNKHQIRMLRIYSTFRRLNSIDPIVCPYVLMDDTYNIQIPDAESIKKFHIVITTLSMSSILLQYDLRGQFTHILIDEAGQALEPAVLQPLTLATQNTCVMLAGDHLQMSPRVFCETARNAKFNKSLLERLFINKMASSVFLTYNYRTCQPILNFIAQTYYHEALRAHGNHPVHKDFYPLMFCAVKGEDQHVGMSYVNNYEVMEIVFRVEELCRKWPENWGKFNKNSIGIITPYSMQVRQIRTEMRRRGLGDISVETVDNVQGKQFRALLISTVRTRKTLEKARLTVVPQNSSSTQQDEEFYYGLLSDHKLLNTALTRAQSLVIVTGDPTALCSEGQCSTTWKAFLKECEKNKSLYPLGTTVEGIRQDIESAKQRLNPFAKTFEPSSSKSNTSPPRADQSQTRPSWGQGQENGVLPTVGKNPWNLPTGASPRGTQVAGNAFSGGLNRQTSDEFPALLTSNNAQQNGMESQSDEDDWLGDDDDVDLEDAILQEFQRQIREDRGELEVIEPSVAEPGEPGTLNERDDGDDINQQDEQTLEPLRGTTDIPEELPRQTLSSQLLTARKKRNVRMIQQYGAMLLIEDNYDRSRLVGADTFEDYDTEEDLEEDMLDENTCKEHLDQVARDPEKFKVCSFHFDLSGHTYALPKDEDSSMKILITSRRKRGKALNLDEVIVEILDDIDELENAAGYGPQTEERKEESKIYGRVTFILKRAANPYLRKIVCTIDKFTDGLMVPIDRTFPKIFVRTFKEGGSQPRTKNKRSHTSELSTVSIFAISRGTENGFQFQKNILVSLKDRPNKLFVVQYLKWQAKTPYPFGIITEELPPGDTKTDGLRILKLVHGIREKWRPAVLEEIKTEYQDNWEVPEEDIQSRHDIRSKYVFTIDPPGSQDLDDALSVEMVDNNYQVGIHIADVSYFVKTDTALDEEAKERATSFYPSFAKTVNMLPPQLSNRLCSLLPEEDRLTISVFITLDENGVIVDEVQIVRSVIQSKIQMTYEYAENIITMTSDEIKSNSIIQDKVLTLSKLAKERRRNRLGVGCFAYNHDSEEEELQHPLAHYLVEEMMLMANEEVARHLLKKYPEGTPLRRQLPPSEESVLEWLDKHGQDLPNSVDLQSKPFQQVVPAETEKGVHVLESKWQKLHDLVTDDEQNDMMKIVDIVCSDDNHPQQSVARSNYFHVMEQGAYVSSGDHQGLPARRHFSLNKDAYTHFTSPIRRYIDLVVHRMLVNTLPGTKADVEPPYTSVELSQICHHCTNQTINSKSFERKTRALQFALKLKLAPQPILSFVEKTSETSIHLSFAYRSFVSVRHRSLQLRLLKPLKKPIIEEGSSSMELMWKHRIYDLSGSPHGVKGKKDGVLRLDQERFIVQVSANLWKEILTGIKTEDIYQIQNAVVMATMEHQQRQQDKEARRNHRHQHESQNLPVVEVTCENGDGNSPSLFVSFTRSFDRGDVVPVQLHASLQMGVLTPSIQLFGLTPKLNLCAEHRGNAIESFAKVALERPLNIKNISKYKKVWLPIIEMLTAHNAIQNDETVIIHGVKIRWDRTFNQDTTTYEYTGYFTIPDSFCEEHHLRFSHSHKSKEKTEVANDDPEVHLDFLCIRYRDIALTHATQLHLREIDSKPRVNRPTCNVHPGKAMFVVHAATIDATKDKGMMVVQLNVTQFSSPFPDILLESDKVPTCTVELIPKTEPDRRLETAVRSLDSDKVSPLIRDICLLQKPRANEEDPYSKFLPRLALNVRSYEIPGSSFAPPNPSQSTALRQALSQPFTVIQGPPGTGKTITGAHLAYFFTNMNKSLPPSAKGRPQVLYCGPSNKSVDVISGYLIKLDVKLVRVYSETIETKDYPIPGTVQTTRKVGNDHDAKMDPHLKEISLHRLIRQSSNTHSCNIRKYEDMFRTEGYKVKLRDVLAYRKEIGRAEEEELKKHEIILCTCNASGSKRIRSFTNIVQCIVDEAGMCNEPETLIPLVGTNPCQIVLIGDHKQLRPIIQEKTAQLLGMEVSLLEKYERKAQMLTIQYRMHEAICSFPSQAFYNGKLETADIVKQRRTNPFTRNIWPGGVDYPLCFCHLYGKEETLTVKTAEGNEQSKANPQEVKHVVRMATTLVKQYNVNPEDVVILSQYRLQCAEIESALKKHGLKNISVRTVITSQGSEWDYVIMSTVRSMPRIEIEEKASMGWKQKNLGFIIDENQMNVALTRAKRGLIIVGNQYLLQTHDKWKDLIDVYREHGAVVDARNFLRKQ
ncbi:uncharacterized protein LOC117291425 isoform X1 [Asterias rubens]|uniref:uncharacterized protein LOC117291425 isoform X1 n=1 Tax=Asterias rubens TaxID=7604 RepID=UPI00145529CA|nr:uncharacterized protein LOC117291425 isoform X1 [Asterias rubens]